MDRKHIQRRIAWLLCVLMMLGVLPLGAAEGPPDTPLARFGITVLVQDADDPSAFMPMAGITVGVHPAMGLLNPLYQQTDANGQVIFEDLMLGMAAGYLPGVDELLMHGLPGGGIYEDYLWDEQAHYVNFSPVFLEKHLVLRLVLKNEENQRTMGVRLQKAYYPHMVNPYLGYNGVSTLLSFAPSDVENKVFVVLRHEFSTDQLLYWQGGEDFSPDQAQALRFTTDASGQLLIMGLPPYPAEHEYLYQLEEVLDDGDVNAYLNDPIYLSEAKPGQVYTLGYPVVNYPQLYSITFDKVDQDTGSRLHGARFVVYSLGEDGSKSYLHYLTGLSAPGRQSGQVFPAYSPELAKAHVFTSRLHSIGYTRPFSFVVPGLMAGETYYLQEIEAPAGYQVAEPLALDEGMAFHMNDYHPVLLENQRLPDSLLVFKEDPDIQVYWPEEWRGRLPGAQFVLAQLQRLDGTEPQPGDNMEQLALALQDEQGNWQSLAMTALYQSLSMAMPQGPFQVSYLEDLSSAAPEAFANTLALGHQVFETAGPTGSFAALGLDPGNYLLIELRPPLGYTITQPVTQIELLADQALPPVIIQNAMPSDQTTVLMQKQDAYTGEPLAGASFRLMHLQEGTSENVPMIYRYLAKTSPLPIGLDTHFTDDPDQALIFVSDQHGRAVISGLPILPSTRPYQHYVLNEVEAPEGYRKLSYNHTVPYMNGPRADGKAFMRLPNTPLALDLSPQPMDLPAAKILEGADLQAGQFTFDLLLDGEVIATASNDAMGNVTFRQVWLTPTLDPNYLDLIIKERIPPQDDFIRYDRGQRTLRVSFYNLSQPNQNQPRQDSPSLFLGHWAILAMILGDLTEPFVNHYEDTSFTASKAWVLPGDVPRQPISLQLLQDGLPYGETLVLDGSEATPWSHTFSGLPKQREFQDGSLHAFTYTVQEEPLSGFLSSIQPVAGGADITNTWITPSPSPSPTTPPAPTPAPTPADHPAIQVPLQVQKILQNGRLKGGEFSFQLKDHQGKVLAQVQNDAQGLVVFPPRSFSRVVSNYLYTITELAGTNPDISYDPTVYTISISTSLVDGRLHAQVDVRKDGTPFGGEVAFINTQSPPKTGDALPGLMLALLGLSLAFFAVSQVHRRRKGRS